MIRVAIADHLPTSVRACASLLGLETDMEVCGTAHTGAQILDIATHHRPDVILLDIEEPGIGGLAVTREIQRVAPDVAIIATAGTGDSREAGQAALQAGARDCLVKPLTAELLVASIRRVNELQQHRELLLRRSVGMRQAAAVRQARVIVVLGSQGGCGKSVLATNLAVLLARRTRQRVGLMDLDLQLGDVGLLLNVTSRLNIADLAALRGDQIDAERLEDTMVDGPEGLRMLLAPRTPDLADTVRIEVVENVLQRLRTSLDWLVVDTPQGVPDITWEALKQVHRCLLVTTPLLTAVKNCRLLLDYLALREVPPDQVLVVGNSVAPEAAEAAERNLAGVRRALTVRLPYDPEVVRRSVDTGSPFVLKAPEAPVSRAVADLVECLLAAPVPVGTGDGQARRS
jgi:pilus assembly protein CpaE